MKLKILLSLFAAALIGVILTSGCDSKEKKESKNKFDLLTTKDGIVYRINKQSGEVLLIAAQSSTLVEGTENIESNTNRVEIWDTIAPSELGDIKVGLKTNWRNGKLYYIFTAQPYDHIKSILQTSADAQFLIYLYDADGFLITVLQVKLAEMTPSAPPFKVPTFEMNASLACDLDSYKTIASWAVSRTGF